MSTYNGVLNVEHYEALKDHPFMGGIKPTRRKHWEICLELTALANAGVLKEDSRVLITGAGAEATIFYLSTICEVHATDLYMQPGVWKKWTTPDFLRSPSMAFENEAMFGASESFPQWVKDIDYNRIIVQHMDMRVLRYPTAYFDAVVCTSSIEHVGDFSDVEQTLGEMIRVVKPGGIITLSTEFLIDGPETGTRNTLMFPEDMVDYVFIEPFKGEVSIMGSKPNYEVDEATLETRYPIEIIAREGIFPAVEGVLEMRGGFVFTSMHLALRRKKTRS